MSEKVLTKLGLDHGVAVDTNTRLFTEIEDDLEKIKAKMATLAVGEAKEKGLHDSFIRLDHLMAGRVLSNARVAASQVPVKELKAKLFEATKQIERMEEEKTAAEAAAAAACAKTAETRAKVDMIQQLLNEVRNETDAAGPSTE